ncbi:MAG: lipoprotein-releasing ABC transporter ATP-binding protein LolD [Legionellaceae bacterium]|nr:lipoprotein-releasing ABC transporter ATP-binding protein LolD [Legionellaceae bacterium]MBP9775649.1 lipoprotein-releasing ABC transporter ATP-binding protein LolD [Legionellaceae bacterium]
MNKPIISCRDLKKAFHDGHNVLHVLRGIDLTITRGMRVAIVGPSGSGKSSLLQLLGGLDVPSSGQVLIQGTDWQSMSEHRRCLLRNQQLGFVYQFHHLLPEFTALENVALPGLLAKRSSEEALQRAQTILTEVGLGARLEHKPSQLSGGERQRVAIARALVQQPACVFADEPTGNLDQKTAAHIFDVMLDLNQRYQTALVVVTHDLNLAARMDKVLTLNEGQLVD